MTKVNASPSGAPATATRSTPLIIASILLVVMMVMGGGGYPSPSSEVAVELLSVLLAIAWIAVGADRALAATPDTPLDFLVLAIVALPLIQLVPLPPVVWQALPGREVVTQSLALTGQPNQWTPWSLDPWRTLAGMLGIVPPLIMFAMVRRLPARDRTTLIHVVLAVAALAAAIGTAQVASNGALNHFYPTMDGYAVGFQANRNSSADIYAIGLSALVAAILASRASGARNGAPLLALACGGTLAVATLLTGSRMGLMLFAVGAFAAIVLLRRRQRPVQTLVLPLIIVLMLGGGALLLGDALPMVGRTLDRFSVLHDARGGLWQDALYQIGQTAPVGSGLGTGSSMLIAAEQLDLLDKTVPNRVHNDYLEYVLEGGILAAAVIVAALAFFVLRLRTIVADGARTYVWSHVVFACGVVFVVAFHSIADYPLRSISIAGLFAFAGALLGKSALSISDSVAEEG